MSAASSSNGSAYSLVRSRRRAKFTMMAHVMAPAMKASTAATAVRATLVSPSTKLSVNDETAPVTCDVYCPTARKPPALMAPATAASDHPSWRSA